MFETLFCENGQHTWERESKRGKKPKNCLNHAPVSAPKSAAELNEAGERKLICEHDGHEWWAPVQRGRPPRFCPEHRPPAPLTARQRSCSLAKERAATTLATHRELYCFAGGHNWFQERKRGKPPRNCPEHAVSGAIERQGELAQEKKEKAQKSLQNEIARLSARVEAAEAVDRDAMSKLEAGGVDSADEETFKTWLRANTILLHEVEALRARQRKLLEL